MDDLLKSIHGDNLSLESFSTAAGNSRDGVGGGGEGGSLSKESVDELFKESVAWSDQGRGGAGEDLECMTLEEFLTKAGVVRKEDVGIPVTGGARIYSVDVMTNGHFQAPQMQAQSVDGATVALGNGIDGRVIGAERGKRTVVEDPVDKATQQKAAADDQE
ncbi:hypothetical protein PVL29_015099 [Vitis rotundifolia]|uniref:Uncharacterized protein n=1 Tax=Vitis rotundifolia TaxID=103349 RepID=A0AA38ZBP5_VITRO|nr:hypothetical protein PVL29_015099 [Vitis rotundifolia]